VTAYRNWDKAGSHGAAENLAFMYSLYESCKMNNLNFGSNIEDILTRMKDGDKGCRAMLPCFYVEKTSEVMGGALRFPYALKAIVFHFLELQCVTA